MSRNEILNNADFASGQVRVREVSINDLKPSPENDTLYRPVLPDDPEILKLAESIRQNGLYEPIVVSLDGYIISGHRRHCAAKLAGLMTVPVRYVDILRTDDIDAFVLRLREHNRQRDKSNDEKLREELLSVDPDQAYRSLISDRQQKAEVDSSHAIQLRGYKGRSGISEVKQPFLKAIVKVVMSLQKYWPISERTIHYHLLNDPPFRNSKSKTRYVNDKKSYKDLSDMCTRGRLMGAIQFQAISDETRPVTTWKVFPDPRAFIREEFGGMFKGYWRDVMVSQPNHIEILAEKNTVEPMLRKVAMQYRIPITSGRGYGSLPPRKAMADRYHNSGKEKLVLIVMSDFDPAGEEIAHSFARSMRDDFDIEKIHAIKAGLNYEQVQSLKLHTDSTAKRGDSNYKRFTEKYGTDVYELEAVMPDVLQGMLRDAIDSVLDIDAFNEELEVERGDAVYLQGVRQMVRSSIKGVL